MTLNNCTGAERGAVVEWLEQPDYGAESRLKVVSLRLDFAMRRLENSTNPAVYSQSIRFARVSGRVTDFNARNKIL